MEATKLSGIDKVIQLLECYDDQLHWDLTRNAGGTLIGKTKVEVFAAMKILAVREENVMVARVTLHNMKQDRGEPIRAYGARLRGQASVFKFLQQMYQLSSLCELRIQRRYFEMCYVGDWRTQRYNLNY